MASTATAVLSLDLDSTLVYKKVDEAQKRVASISKMTIVPQISTTQIAQQVQQVKSQAGILSSVFSKIKVGIDTIQTKRAVSKNLKDVEQEIKLFEKNASGIFDKLGAGNTGSRGGYRTKQLERNFKDLSLSTAFSRNSIVNNFDEIFRTLEKSGAKSKYLDDLRQKLQAISTGGFAGAKDSQNPFQIGVATAPNVRASMKDFEEQIKIRAAIIQQFRDRVIADLTKPSAPVVIKPSVQINPQLQVAKPDRTKFLASLSEFATANAGPEFVKRFEWGQISSAVATEAEAAFGNEAIGRKISNQIFSFSPSSAGLGYVAGKVTETLAGLAKTISVGAVRAFDVLPTAIGNSLAKSQDQASQKVGAVFQNIGETIKRVTAIPVAAIVGAFSLYQIIINKSTVSFAFAISSGLTKIIWMGFQKIASTTFEAGKWLAGKITSIFSGGGGGGGGLFSGVFSGGGGGNELSIGISSFLGLAGLGTTINLAANLQEKMLAVSTLTGEIGAGLGKSTRDVIAISNDFGKSANDVASALYDIRSASFAGQDGLLVLRSSLVASQGGLTSVSVASTAIARTLRAWNLPATEAATIADVLFNTVKRGITTFDTLAQQITQVTQVAASVGASFQDVGAAMANLTRNGQTTDQAVTGLAALFKSIIAPTDAGVEAMKELGIEWTESALRGKGFLKFLQDVAPKVLANKRAFRELVGDVTAMKSAFVLLGDINGLSEDLNAMSERGAANFAASRIAISFNDQLRVFWENFLNIARNIGQTMLPMIQPVLEKAVEFVQMISGMSNMDIGELWTKIKDGIFGLKDEIFAIGETVVTYAFAKWNSIRNFVEATIIAIMNSSGRIVSSVLYQIMKELTIQLLKFVGFMAEKIGWLFSIIWETIDSNIYNVLGSSWDNFKDFMGEVWEKLKEIKDFFANLFGSEKTENAVIPIENKKSFWTNTINDVSKFMDQALDPKEAIEHFGENFKSGFLSIYDEKLFSPNVEKKAFDDLSKNLTDLQNKAEIAFRDFGKEANTALKQQSEGMSALIKSLDEQYKSELQKGEKDKAQLTKQFLDAEKDRLKNLTSQLDRSQLDVLLEKRQKLYIELAKVQRDQNVKQTQVVIDQIKTNELIILKLEKESRLAHEKAKQGIDPQINLYDTLKAKALALVKEGEKAGNSLTKLSDVLDEVFGKNIERIAEKYGVGRELVTMRNLTRDVIEAKAAGFSASDLDIIIQTGLMEKSDQLTKVFNSLGVAKKNISVDRVKELGIYDDLVILLDRASNLGLSEAGRMRLLQGKITEEAFKELDQATIADKETNFISTAMRNFENAGEGRKLQERFNDAQLRLSEITKEAVTRNQKMKQTVDTLEKTVKELEIEAKKTKRNSNSVDGD